MTDTARGSAAGLESAAPPAVGARRRTLLDLGDLLWLTPLALAVRIAALIAFPSLHHPDETFQVFEPAHRLAFGYGVVTWEFNEGIRSYVLPYLFSWVFRLAAAVRDDPAHYIFVARLLLIGLSILPVIVGYVAFRSQSRTHAIIIAFASAIGFEQVYFSSRPLTEAVACDFFLSAACLAVMAKPRRGTLLALGFMLSMAFCLRYHLVAGIAVLAIAVIGRDPKTNTQLLLTGAAAPLAVFAVTDWLTWGFPFASLLNSINLNLVQDKASEYGVSDPFLYVRDFIYIWGAALGVVAFFLVAAARRHGLWILAAIAIVGMHAFIQHKEYRFVYPAFALLALAAAAGSADLLVDARKASPDAPYGLLVGAACGMLLLTSANLALSGPYKVNWYRTRHYIQAFYALSRESDLCGLLIPEDNWDQTGGYAYLHRHIPIYVLPGPLADARPYTGAFNVAVVRRSTADTLTPAYVRGDCFTAPGLEDICLVKRPGGCETIPKFTPLLDLKRFGERDTVHSSLPGASLPGASLPLARPPAPQAAAVQTR